MAKPLRLVLFFVVVTRSVMPSLSTYRPQATLLIGQMLLATAALTLLAYGVRSVAGPVFTEGPLFTFDTTEAQWLRHQQTPLLLLVMQSVSALHGTVGILLLAALYAWWLQHRGATAWGVHVLLTAGGALLMNVALKNVFARTRPSFDGVAASLHSFSFPSGHTVGATVFYGLLVLGVWRLTRRVAVRLASVGLALSMVLGVASSRLYLGAHFVSDTGGGIVVGLLWLGFCAWTWPKPRALPRAPAVSADSAQIARDEAPASLPVHPSAG